MAAQPPPWPRKRSGPALCGAGWAGAAPPAARGRGGAVENGFPPHKRPKSAGLGEGPGDPFGDSDDFTADDLEEIDNLASQALSQEPVAPRAAPPAHAWGGGGERAAGLPRGGAPAAAGTWKGRCSEAAGTGGGSRRGGAAC